MQGISTSMQGTSVRGHRRASPLAPLHGRPLRHPGLVAFSQQGGGESQQAAKKEKLKKEAAKAARGAQSTLKNLYESAQESAGRMWIRLDSEYSLNFKIQRAGKRVQETLRDIDQTWNVRRNIRRSVEYVQRKWPLWQRQLDQFATTWYGKVTLLLGLLIVISSPIFWSLLNVVLLLWWLAIPIGAALVNTAQKRAAARVQEAEEEEARRANPFSEIFRPKSGGSSVSRATQEGPVIEAEYVTLKQSRDEDDKK